MRRIVLALGICSAAFGADFAKDVQPVLMKRCVMCHGAAQQLAGVRFDNGPDALKGGYSGPVIVAGKAEASKLIERVTSTKNGFRMPPMGASLSDAEVESLKSWISEGAVWPAGLTIGKATTRKSNHWAFQPLWKGELPAVKQADWVRNPIDRFVLSKLEKEGIAPSPEASRTVLLRRVTLDLTGLPPTADAMRKFLADTRPDAYERAVDELLSSRQYGERWARQWLDLARYADSDGYEKDLIRPYAWRWRNYVIESFNADKPFDQFTVEQLAGDLLPNATLEQKVATGFHRNTLINREAGVPRAEDRFETLVNRVNTTSTTWLGLTMGCSQCHDHKYDPISQREYYSAMAVFSNSRDTEIDAPLSGELGPWLASRTTYLKKRGEILKSAPVQQWFEKWQEKMRSAVQKPGTDIEWDFSVTSFRVMFDHADETLLMPEEQRSERDQWRLMLYFLSNSRLTLRDDKEGEKKLKEIRDQIAKLEEETPKLTQASVVIPDPKAPAQRMAVRGDWKTPGIEVQPAALAVLPEFKPAGEPERLAYARWLVSDANDLTPRVIVNRYWQEFFGRGIVKTSEDFGTQGDKPSHPELLDHLAREFRANGWSVKKLHRTIVTSATYRQASKARADIAERDPDNAWLSRQSRLRLSAESIRDVALATSGLLSMQVGGPSVRPPQPKGVAELVYGNSGKWVESTGADKYRRGLYIVFQRTAPYPMLTNFDAPDMTVACSRRRSSDTPLQALNLLNDPVFYEAAQALAYRVATEAPAETGAKIDYAVQLALGRKASATELTRLKKYVDEQPKETAWVGLARVLMNLDEFIVRE
ncbi:PSD1 and planctomycete cytochrome C domain-containing protein [Bryobacter aggregatus]|uniref:PSD1 and planctomycete cytochrome C domain-containing protein n=1 Tax=Bryobacter aggregatus TaxID=360054 RepID=UPI0004E0B4F1|nr:PSD1 and planctomycete cytochrome C domain-containing protein [Bryobacter aggregatus]